MTDPAKTGAPDVMYDMVSILYHALHGAQVYDQYIQDAEQEGKQELASFFRDVREQDKERAQRANELLKQLHQQQAA